MFQMIFNALIPINYKYLLTIQMSNGSLEVFKDTDAVKPPHLRIAGVGMAE